MCSLALHAKLSYKFKSGCYEECVEFNVPLDT